MKRLGTISKLGVAVAVLTCVAAVTASAALAVAIEPLNKHFESTSQEVTWGQASFGAWTCESAKFAGTSNSTKTNYVNVTPTFTKCVAHAGFEIPFTFKNSCKTEGTVPWTMTLTKGSAGVFSGNIKLNCALTITTNGCNLTVAEQVAQPENGLTWDTIGENPKGSKSEIKWELTALKYTAAHSTECERYPSSLFGKEGTLTLHTDKSFIVAGLGAF